jgi:hypothetical protein
MQKIGFLDKELKLGSYTVPYKESHSFDFFNALTIVLEHFHKSMLLPSHKKTRG